MPCQMHGVRRGFKAKAKDHGQLVCGDPMLHIRSCCISSRFVFFFKRFCTLLIVTHTTTPGQCHAMQCPVHVVLFHFRHG